MPSYHPTDSVQVLKTTKYNHYDIHLFELQLTSIFASWATGISTDSSCKYRKQMPSPSPVAENKLLDIYYKLILLNII